MQISYEKLSTVCKHFSGKMVNYFRSSQVSENQLSRVFRDGAVVAK